MLSQSDSVKRDFLPSFLSEKHFRQWKVSTQIFELIAPGQNSVETATRKVPHQGVQQKILNFTLLFVFTNVTII